MRASHRTAPFASSIDRYPDAWLAPRDRLAVADVDALLSRILDWGAAYDLDAVLAAKRAERDHARAVDHLAALALAGEVGPLERYAAAARDGAAHPFLPYVTAAMIERALNLGRRARGSR